MKKLIYLICFAVMAAWCGGCSDPGKDEGCPLVLRDYVTISVAVFVEDEDGNDLLNPDFEGNILDNDISVKDGTHIYKLGEEAAKTRANMPTWYGLKIGSNSGRYYLSVGEFGIGARRTLTYDWGDGTTDEVRFAYYTTPATGCEDPEVHMEAYLNDEAVSGSLKIIKKRTEQEQ